MITRGLPEHLERSLATTVHELFAARVRAHPDRIALREGGATRTYAELDDRCTRLAAVLAGRGVTRGDVVAILSENRLEYVEAMLAAARLGAVLACQNWRLSAREIAECLDLVDPAVVIVSPRHEALLVDDGRDRIVLGIEFEETVAHAAVPAGEEQVVDPEDPLLVIYTSGTTGRSKGAVIGHRAEVFRNLVTRAEYGLAPEDAFVAWTPLFHMGAADNTLGTLMAGGTVVLIDGYDVDELLAAVSRYRIGWLLLMPGMVAGFAEALHATRTEPAGVRVCGVMPDLVDPTDIARVTRLLDAPFANTFGSTETGCPPCSAGLLPPGRRPTSLAKTQSAFCDLRLVSAGSDVPVGISGEAWMRGPTLFSGYWRDPVANARDFADGWFHMGDLLVRNEDGTLDFVDRAKYLIKSGGENIYPAEIERVLRQHPLVADVAVVRKPDARWGEVPVAFVVPAGPGLDAESLLDLCRRDLASYKRPKEFVFEADRELPRNDTGKVIRAELESRLTGGLRAIEEVMS